MKITKSGRNVTLSGGEEDKKGGGEKGIKTQQRGRKVMTFRTFFRKDHETSRKQQTAQRSSL